MLQGLASGPNGSGHRASRSMYLTRQSPASILLVSLFLVSLLFVTAACSPKRISSIASPALPANDKSYEDLVPGGRIRIIVPLGNKVDVIQQGSTDVVSGRAEITVQGVVGFRTVYYRVVGTQKKKVKLEFESSYTSRDGTTVQDPERPELPFKLPSGSKHVRLVYMVRLSSADHNMAILASKYIGDLNAFTARFQDDPTVCDQRGEVQCAWVPAGVAVRPEPQNRK